MLEKVIFSIAQMKMEPIKWHQTPTEGQATIPEYAGKPLFSASFGFKWNKLGASQRHAGFSNAVILLLHVILHMALEHDAKVVEFSIRSCSPLLFSQSLPTTVGGGEYNPAADTGIY